MELKVANVELGVANCELRIANVELASRLTSEVCFQVFTALYFDRIIVLVIIKSFNTWLIPEVTIFFFY